MKNLRLNFYTFFGSVFFVFCFLLFGITQSSYANENNEVEQKVFVQDNMETSTVTNTDQTGYYDLYARSSIRSSLGLLGGDFQENATLLFDNIQTKWNVFVENLAYNFLPKFIPQVPQKKYQIETTDDMLILKSTIESGDSLGSLLNGWINFSTILNIVEDSKETFSLASLKVGKPIIFYINKKDFGLKHFEYELDMTHKVTIDLSGEKYQVEFQEIPYEYKLAYVEGKVKVNFFNSVLATNERAIFAIRLADVFTYDIDFAREIREGDSFSALVEKQYKEGQFIGYGRIIGATFVNKGKKYEAFLYHDSEEDKKISYYNRNGDALQKAFLRTPVHFTRISSHYTMARKHPILGYTRPHQGVDYAAPKGTPVMAVADGEVTRAAYTGGYGHLIILKHKGSLESQYAHLSGYAKGIKRGASVTQGQVIGYVGSTGLSTGPHLDFRIKKKGSFVNPEEIIIPNKLPIDDKQIPAYKKCIKEVEAYMQGDKKVDEFVAEEWLQGIR